MIPLPSNRRPTRRFRLSTLMLLAAIGLYWAAFKDVALRRALLPFMDLHTGHLAAFVLLNIAIIVVMCCRWKLILGLKGYAIGFHLLAAYRIGANAISYITPGPQFGGEPVQVSMLVKRHHVPSQNAVASVAVDRLIELCTNCFFLFFGLIYLFQTRIFGSAFPVEGFVGLTLMMLASGWLLLALAAGKTPLSQWLESICRRFSGLPGSASVSDSVKAAERRAGEMLRQPIHILLLYFGTALTQWLLMIGEFWFIYYLSGLPLNMVQLIGVVVAARLAFLLPLPGALGALEASQVLMLTFFALDPAIVLTVCIIIRARDMVLVGAGICLVWLWLTGRPKLAFRWHRGSD